MKKTTFLAVALCLTASVFAYEQVTHLNPYAYNVSAQERSGRVAVSYNLNAPAESTVIAIYCDGVEVGTQAVEGSEMGLHTAVVDLSAYTQGGTYTFGIRVNNTSYDEPTQFTEILDGSTDITAVNYPFWHPKGVAIDRNPFSENFGRIITAEAQATVPAENYWSSADGCGLYVFDPTFAPVTNGNGYAFKGGYDYGLTLSNGATRASAPYRIKISDDNRIFVSMQDDRYNTLYEVSADLQTWTPIFSGTYTDGVIVDAEGNYVTGINAGLDVKGSGEDLELIMLNCNLNAFSSYSGNDFMVATYKLGTATSWTGAATTADTLSALVGAGVVPVAGNVGVAYDGQGGFWYSGNRANAIDQRALVHINAKGEADWAISEKDSVLFNLGASGLNGGGNVTIVDDMLIIGTGVLGHMLMFEVDYTEGVTLTKKYEVPLIGIGRNLNAFDIDFGHNLYTVGNSNEKIVAVALPYSGTNETPINLEVVKEGAGVENVTMKADVQKVIENGQVVIIKDGVRYNVLGTTID